MVRVKRRQRWLVIGFGVFLFLGISVLLTRALVGAGTERSLVRDVVRAQARGDADAVLAKLPECRRSATCAQLTRDRTARLRRPGTVEILNFTPSAQLTLSNRSGYARVVWRTEQRTYPVVQCVFVRRQGPLTGGGVELVSISNPIGLQANCGR